MKVGDRVRTTQSWLDEWITTEPFTGTVKRVRDRGAHPVHPERTHYVELDEKIGPFDGLWFDPNDLELVEVD